MQLASHGVRGASRKAPSLLTHPPGRRARTIHASSSFAQAPKSAFTSKPIHRLVSWAETLLGHRSRPACSTSSTVIVEERAFLTYAPNVSGATPGLHTTIPSYSRNVNALRVQPIRRAASPLLRTSPQSGRTLFFPRPPQAAPPCSVNNVGLGTARQFSTGRPIFQALTENVPVVGRSFYEADWDIKTRKERIAARKLLTKAPKSASKGRAIRPKSVTPSVQKISSPEDEIEQYFKLPAPQVSTSLFIPLAPTPTSRTPLPQGITDHQSLLPLGDLAAIHNNHELHSLRVSSLFARLDAANVWDRGVQCSAYAHRAGPEGVCTIIKVEFLGWTKAEVRSVIGESGTGWCTLEEDIRGGILDTDNGSDISETLSQCSGMTTPDSEMEHPLQLDTTSFILPTLNFSSSFTTSTSTASTAPVEVFSDSASDAWSDVSSDSNESWMGFSSDFASRLETMYEPKDNIS